MQQIELARATLKCRFASGWSGARVDIRDEGRNCIVIGGGLAGVTAALALADGGHAIILLEASGSLGGRVRSVTDPASGRKFDNCQHAAFRVYGRFLQFMSRIDARSSLRIQQRTHLPFIDPSDGRIGVLRTGRLSPPNHMFESMLRFPFLSLSDKIGMRRVIKALNRMSEQERWALDDVKFTDWLLQQRQSEAAINRFWGYFTLAALNLPASEASTTQAAFLFKEGLFGAADAFDVACFTRDLSLAIGTPALAALKATGIDVRLNTSCRDLLFDSGRCVGVSTKAGDLLADSVILATPHGRTARLLSSARGAPASSAAVSGRLSQLGTRSLIGLHALHAEPITPPGFTFAAVIDEPVIQMVFDRNSELDPAEWIDGHQWISVPVSAAEPWLDWSDDRLRAEYMRVIRQLWPDAGEPASFHVIKNRRATFAPTTGQHSLRPATTDAAPGLYLAGSYVATDWPSTMESAVRSGMDSAAAVLAEAGDEAFSGWSNRNDWPTWSAPPRRHDEAWLAWQPNG